MMSHECHDSTEMLIKIINNCEMMCEDTATYVIRCYCDKTRVRQLRLLRDCADICSLTAKYIARDSVCAKPTAELCADICEICGEECAKHPDHQSQHCSRVCLHCARECHEFAMS